MSKKYKRLNNSSAQSLNNQQQPTEERQPIAISFGIQSEEPQLPEEPAVINEEPITISEEVQNESSPVTSEDETIDYVIPDRQHLLHLMKCKLNNNKQLPYAHITKSEEASILKNYSLMKFGRMQPLEVLMTSVLKRDSCVG